MALQKLETVDAFVVRDLDPETPAVGIVRAANKILQGGAKELARSQTYQCAVLEMKLQGASCGINAPVESREDAIAGYCAELLPAVQSGSLMIDAAKGVGDAQLASLTAADGRNQIRTSEVDGVSNRAHLGGLGAVTCAAAAKSLDGATVAIENFDATGLTVARAASAAGAKVVSISTAAGAAFNPDGFDVDALASGLAASGVELVTSLSDEELPFWRIIGADADVLFAGSKMGLIDHKNAGNVKATLVVPTGPIPYTTKGALMLERQGVTVLPDFVTTAGALLAGFPTDTDSSQAAIEADVQKRLGALTESILGKDDSPILQACYQSETFLKSWREELPFGRPFAA